jgi:hypothetical protein
VFAALFKLISDSKSVRYVLKLASNYKNLGDKQTAACTFTFNNCSHFDIHTLITQIPKLMSLIATESLIATLAHT